VDFVLPEQLSRVAGMLQFAAAVESGGKSALWLAAAAGHAEAVAVLLKVCCSCNERDVSRAATCGSCS